MISLKLLLGVAVMSDVSGDTVSGSVKVAFGSCSKPDRTTEIWKSVAAYGPDAWVWMGDNVYADKKVPQFVFRGVDEAKELYSETNRNADYQTAMSTVKHLFGTWDDHDMGLNNAGGEFPFKRETKELTLNFLQYPKDHITRTRDGLHHSYVINENSRTEIKFILPDTRWWRSEMELLGDIQWAWLEGEIRDCATRRLCVFVSSIQVTASWGESVPILKVLETWGNYPKELERLLRLFDEVATTPMLMLSGDVHMGEVRVIHPGPQGACRFAGAALTRPIVEVTASGITHSLGTFLTFPKRLWKSAIVDLDLTPYAINSKLDRRITIAKNFGTLDWDGEKVVMTIRGEPKKGGPDASVIMRYEWTAAQLTGQSYANNKELSECESDRSHPSPYGAWSLLCVALVYLSIEFTVLILPFIILFSIAKRIRAAYLKPQPKRE